MKVSFKDVLEHILMELKYPKDRMWMEGDILHCDPNKTGIPIKWAIELEDHERVLQNCRTLPAYGKPVDVGFAGLHLMEGIAHTTQ